MNALRKQIDKIKPAFTKGGRFAALESVFDGFETFLFVPNTTSKRRGVHVHDAIDSKRTMSVVIFALLPLGTATDRGILRRGSGDRVHHRSAQA